MEWHLKMQLNWECSKMEECNLTISDLKFGDQTVATKKEELTRIVADHLERPQELIIPSPQPLSTEQIITTEQHPTEQ